ncbi:MAG: alpha/beta fold hydrolase, partial [Planctomycetota bacterium]
LLDLVVWGFLGAARRRPRWFTRRLLEATETFDEAGIAARTESIMRHPEQVTWLLGLLSCAFPLGVRKVGLDNDLAQFAALDDEPAGPITRPTLVVHGRHDGNVPFEHARLVLDAVPGARACIAETCGHLLWMSEEVGKVREAVHDFVREHARDRGGEAGGPTGR